LLPVNVFSVPHALVPPMYQQLDLRRGNGQRVLARNLLEILCRKHELLHALDVFDS
jgi:hypothetical protein